MDLFEWIANKTGLRLLNEGMHRYHDYVLSPQDQQLNFPLQSAFVALPLQNEAKRRFLELQEQLQDFESSLRFQNPQTPHLTLHYWREMLQIEYGQFLEEATKIASAATPFTLRVIGADTFGARGQERVLYLDIAFSEELARLKKSCPWTSDRAFVPHITLARITHPQRFAAQKKKIMKRLARCDFAIPVDRLRFYAAIEGHKQTPLGDFVFGEQD